MIPLRLHRTTSDSVAAQGLGSEFDRFLMDARRWVDPGKIADPSALTWRTLLWLLYSYMSLRAMAWLRFGQWCRRKRIPLMTGIIGRHLHRTYGLEISVDVQIGGGLYIAHTTGCVIRPQRMGQNCSIIASATIGMRNKWEFPVLGDGVFIGAGARVLGGVWLGDGAVIGANAVVIHDIPAHATAVGIPARVIRSATLD